MAATYTPDTSANNAHGLSAAALALSAERFATEVLVAERVLGLKGSSLAGDDTEEAKKAVALQVNLQVRLASGEAADVKSESKGRQSITYATMNGVRVAVDSLAQSIVAGLLGPTQQSTLAEATFRW
ncbi:MAG TPA: hypothetical protein VLH81_11365 [Desulfobacterales bacterium]|nr:hypothetical protein [Desulfobacterales bacterium]